MLTYTRNVLLPATRQAVWDLHAHPGSLEALSPPGTVEVVEAGPLQDGGRVVMRVTVPGWPWPLRWVSVYAEVRPPLGYVDVAQAGLFRPWEHRHLLEERDGGCLLREVVTFGAPLGWVGEVVSGPVVRRMLDAQLGFRHRKLLAMVTGDTGRLTRR
jgi:hypothetical protein